jgi:hypothetical protein
MKIPSKYFVGFRTTEKGLNLCGYILIVTMTDLMVLSLFVLHGTLLVLMTRKPRQVEAMELLCVSFYRGIHVLFFFFFTYWVIGFEPESAHAANNGLVIARDLMEKIHKKHPEISYGDLWTLAGVCAIQELVNRSFCFFFLKKKGHKKN